jgi:hypothetical protein
VPRPSGYRRCPVETGCTSPRHMAESGLPHSKAFATLDFAAVPAIRQAHVMNLAEGDA